MLKASATNNPQAMGNQNPAEKIDALDFSVNRTIEFAQKVRRPHKAKAEQASYPDFNKVMHISGRQLLYSDIIALISAYVVAQLVAIAYRLYFDSWTATSLYASAKLHQFCVFLVLGTIAIIWLDSKGHYRQRLPYWEKLSHFATVATVGLVCGGFIQYAMKDNFSRVQLGTSWVLFGVFLFIGRVLTRQYLQKLGLWDINALIIGTHNTASAFMQAMKRERHMGYNIVSQMSADSMFHLKKSEAWKQLLNLYEANHVFLALEGGEIDVNQASLKGLVRSRVPYSVVPPWTSLPSSSMSHHHFFSHDVVMMTDSCVLERPLPRFIKRTFDIIVAAFALIALTPVFVVVSLLVKRDGGPVFFGHRRIGYDGESFECLKFRSMLHNGDQVLREHLASNPVAQRQWETEYKLQNDPRVTRFGKFLRSSSLDELPQLINVLRGDMSLVGPRPIVLAEVDLYDSDIAHYYRVRPGITGLWQASGRNDVSYAQRVHMDSWYVRNWSLWHDMTIILKTIPVVLKRTGAY